MSRPAVIFNIQALRAIAALLVVGRHVGNPQIGVETHFFPSEPSLIQPILGTFGGIGIDIFFVISGFIMMTTTWHTFGQPNAGLTFFGRRLLRIYPPYWLALTPIVIGSLATAGHLMRSHVGMTMNVLADITLFPQAGLPTLGVSWTLSYEMLFYVVFACLLCLPAIRVVPALILWAIVQCGLYVAFAGSHDVVLHFLGSVLPVEFIAGAGIGWLYVHDALRFPRTALIAAICATLGLWTAFAVYGETLGLGAQWLRTLVILIPSSLLVYSAVAVETLLAVRAPGWLVALGNASYSLYLWHVTILFAIGYSLAGLKPHGWPIHVALVVLMLAVTIGASMAIYEYLEKPLTAALHQRLFHGSRKPVTSKPLSIT